MANKRKGKGRLARNIGEAQFNDYFLFNHAVLVQGYAMAPLIGGAVNLRSAMILALGGILLLLYFPGSVFLVMMGSFFYGVTLALGSVTLFALVSRVYGEKMSGTAMEYLTPFSALYPPLLTVYGVLYDVTGAYTAVLLLCGGLCLTCLLLLLLIESRAKRDARAESGSGS